jgi:hypothetical protein
VVINLQYFTLLLGTFFSGGFFGVLFGVIDIEKQFKNIFWLMMLVEAVEFNVFAPVGLLHGGTIGFFFMILRFCENKLRIEKQIFRSYGGTYIGYKDISLKSSDEEDYVPMLGDKDQSFFLKDQSEIDQKNEPFNLQPFRNLLLMSDSDEEIFTL